MDVPMFATVVTLVVAPVVLALVVALAVVLFGAFEADVWAEFLQELGLEIVWGAYDPQVKLDGVEADPMDAPPLAAVGCLAQAAPAGFVEDVYADVYMDVIEELLLLDEQEAMEAPPVVEVELSEEEEDLILFQAYPVPAKTPALVYVDLDEQLRLLEAA